MSFIFDTELRDEDINLLAFMCAFCKEDVVKKRKFGIFAAHYAYYIPEKDKDLNVAKELFKQNGINMRVHYSHIQFGHGRYALRMRYGFKKNYDMERNFFRDIIARRKNLFTDGFREQESILEQKVQRLREQFDLSR